MVDPVESSIYNDGHQNNSTNQGGRKKKICWDYNSGNYTYGFGCKSDHRCGVCGKLGHGAHICRKVKQFSQGNGRQNDYHGRKSGKSLDNSYYKEDGHYECKDRKEKWK